MLESTNKMSELETDLKEADELYDSNETQRVHGLLMKHKDLQNAEVEWRLARACRVLAEKSTDSEKKKALTYETLDHAKLALSLDDKNFACHKVSAFLSIYPITSLNREIKHCIYSKQQTSTCYLPSAVLNWTISSKALCKLIKSLNTQ